MTGNDYRAITLEDKHMTDLRFTHAYCSSCDWDGEASQSLDTETGRCCPNCDSQSLKFQTAMSCDARSLFHQIAQSHKDVAGIPVGLAIISGALITAAARAREIGDKRIIQQFERIGY